MKNDLIDINEKLQDAISDIEELKTRRVSQSSIPPQTIKSRHLEEGITLNYPSIIGLTAYANNAAAIAGGLSIGQLYRIGDTVGIVH